MSKFVTPGSVCCLLSATGRERLVLACPGFYIPLSRDSSNVLALFFSPQLVLHSHLDEDTQTAKSKGKTLSRALERMVHSVLLSWKI